MTKLPLTLLFACGGGGTGSHEAPFGTTGVAVTLPGEMNLEPTADTVTFVPTEAGDVHRKAGTTIELEEVDRMPEDADLDLEISLEANWALQTKDKTSHLTRSKQGDVLTLSGHKTDKRGSIEILEAYLPSGNGKAVKCTAYSTTVDHASWNVCLSLHKTK